MSNELRVKICGIRTLEAAQTAVQYGASLVGLVFYPPSPRYLSDEEATTLSQQIKALENPPALVGLFVNASLAELRQAAQSYRLDYLQLSGDETPAEVAEAAKLRPVIKSLRFKEQSEAEIWEIVDQFGQLDGVTLLLDSHKPGLYGGTGQLGDWTLARKIAERYPVLLAGGLNPTNVAEAVRQVAPWGVDVSSGVEQLDRPGHKDLNRIKEFCQAALGAGERDLRLDTRD